MLLCLPIASRELPSLGSQCPTCQHDASQQSIRKCRTADFDHTRAREREPALLRIPPQTSNSFRREAHQSLRTESVSTIHAFTSVRSDFQERAPTHTRSAHSGATPCAPFNDPSIGNLMRATRSVPHCAPPRRHHRSPPRRPADPPHWGTHARPATAPQRATLGHRGRTAPHARGPLLGQRRERSEAGTGEPGKLEIWQPRRARRQVSRFPVRQPPGARPDPVRVSRKKNKRRAGRPAGLPPRTVPHGHSTEVLSKVPSTGKPSTSQRTHLHQRSSSP
jgi:hypothetical protein